MSADFDPHDLRGQERAKSKADSEKQLSRAREIDDFRWLMAHKQGRRIVWRLLEHAGVFRTSFTGNAETYFREGMRNMGLLLVGEIHETCPEQYHVMLKEHSEHGRKRNADNRASKH